MTPDEIKQVAQIVMAFDWQLAVGVALAALYLLIGIRLLLKEPPKPEKGQDPDPRVEFYRTWRAPIMGLAFTILGCWAAGGAKGIASSFAGWSTFGLFLYAAYRLWRKAHRWFRNMPLVGQTYHIKGIGEVTITQVQGDTPLDARVQYQDASGRQITVNGIQFQSQGRLLEDREVKPEVTEL